jgi:hypothetical protein
MRLLAAVAAALLSCGSSSSVVDLAAADGPPPPPPPPPPWHEKQHRHDGGGWPYTPPSFPDSCLGEYSFCNSTGSCVLDSANATMCGACKKGEYLCPGPALVCAGSAAEYRTACPGLQGTHLDETLPIEQRLDYLVAHTTLADWVPQMCTSVLPPPHSSVLLRPSCLLLLYLSLCVPLLRRAAAGSLSFSYISATGPCSHDVCSTRRVCLPQM